MLHWLRNIVPKRVHVLSRLFLLVSSAHIAALAVLFVSSKGQHAYALEIAKRLQLTADTKIMFMPLYKTTKALDHAASRGQKGSISGGRGTSARGVASSKSHTSARAATSLMSDVSGSVHKKKSTKNFLKQKKDTVTRTQKKAEQPTEQKKNKSAVIKAHAKEVKKELEKPLEASQEPVKPSEPVAPIKQKESVFSADTQQGNQPEAAGTVSQDGAQEHVGQSGQDIVYIGQEEYDALGMQTYLQQELGNHWQPPLGIPVDVFCDISFMVDWQGKATEVTVSKPSGVLVYDISARASLFAMEFPEWARGKSFKITFKQ